MLGDPIFWIFVLPGLLLGAYAQSRIKINIANYSQVGTDLLPNLPPLISRVCSGYAPDRGVLRTQLV
jgi:hypothetical protein